MRAGCRMRCSNSAHDLLRQFGDGGRRLARVRGRDLALTEPSPHLRQPLAQRRRAVTVVAHRVLGEREPHRKIGCGGSHGKVDSVSAHQVPAHEQLGMRGRLGECVIDRAEQLRLRPPRRTLRKLGHGHAELDPHVGVRGVQQLFHVSSRATATDIRTREKSLIRERIYPQSALSASACGGEEVTDAIAGVDATLFFSSRQRQPLLHLREVFVRAADADREERHAQLVQGVGVRGILAAQFTRELDLVDVALDVVAVLGEDAELALAGSLGRRSCARCRRASRRGAASSSRRHRR